RQPRGADFYLSPGRNEPDPSFFAARFSLRRSLRVFCGFCFCCFLGFSELLLMRNLPAAPCSRPARTNEVLAPHVESCSPGLLRLARRSASGDCGPSAGVLAAGPVRRFYSS